MNSAEAEYLVIGGYAVIFYAEPRFTKDLDVLVRCSSAHAARIWHALADFGAPMDVITVEELAKPGMVFQLGVPPNRIDILTKISGVEFDEAWSGRIKAEYGGEEIWLIGLDELIRAKLAAGRPKDLLDAEVLELVRSKR
ncbi:MAG: hypothetical protein HN348_00805 [Proteobacteria bacterium]|nr:hypothetical protein [Pseudomonadota bacterium]